MKEKDWLSKQIFKRNEIFCELFNKLVFKGKKIVKEKALVDFPTSEFRSSSRNELVRDLLKQCVIKMDSVACYVLLGIEVQSEIDYTMPLRIIEYDISRYIMQIQEMVNQERLQGEKWLSCSEAMSRFGKNDKLIPVITVVVYLGKKPWDGPVSLQDMFAPQYRCFEPFLPDYRMTLLSGNDCSDEILSRLHPDLQGIFSAAKGEHYLLNLLDKSENTDYISKISNDAKKLMNKLVDCELFVEDSGGNMATYGRTVEDFVKSACFLNGKDEGIKIGEDKGLKIGMTKGIKIGKDEGIKIGKTEGMTEERQATMLAFVRNFQNVLEPQFFLSSFMNTFRLSKKKAQKCLEKIIS